MRTLCYLAKPTAGNEWEFSGVPVVKNPSANAGDVGSIPGRGTRIPHAAEELNLHATATEPVF